MSNELKACLKVSFKKSVEYRFEVIMFLIATLFNISFILIFWYSVARVFNLPVDYSQMDILLFSALTVFSSAINEMFFCNNVLPYEINDGSLDTYLIKPGNKVMLYIFNNMNVASFATNLVIALVFGAIAVILGHYSGLNILIAIVLVIVGVVDMALISAIIALSSFWFGIVDNIRNIIYSFEEIKKYPMRLFPSLIRVLFTFVIPISLITYYPFEIAIGNMNLDLTVIAVYAVINLCLILVFKKMLKEGLARYESNN